MGRGWNTCGKRGRKKVEGGEIGRERGWRVEMWSEKKQGERERWKEGKGETREKKIGVNL